MQYFKTPPNHIRMGLGPEILPHQDVRTSYRLCQAYHLVWEFLSLFQAPGVFLSLVLLCMYVNGPQAYHYLSGQGPSAARGGYCRPNGCGGGGEISHMGPLL